jgi:hypothetical protein
VGRGAAGREAGCCCGKCVHAPMLLNSRAHSRLLELQAKGGGWISITNSTHLIMVSRSSPCPGPLASAFSTSVSGHSRLAQPGPPVALFCWPAAPASALLSSPGDPWSRDWQNAASGHAGDDACGVVWWVGVAEFDEWEAAEKPRLATTDSRPARISPRQFDARAPTRGSRAVDCGDQTQNTISMH